MNAPICPSTASQGAQILLVYLIWMWDAVNVNGGYAASTMTPQHHTGSAIPHFPYNSPPPAHVIRLWMHPYAHPQHLKVLKYFLYI
jgi:hypothetical protein